MKRILSFLICLITLLASFSLPVNFSEAEAADGAKKGIDLSRYDGDVDFSVMKKRGVDFVILRCYSYWTKDARFDEYYENATANGIDVGSYNYMYALTTAEAKKEANAAVAVLDGRLLEYPHFLDVEDKSLKNAVDNGKLTKKELTELCLIEMKIFEKAGYHVGMYCSRAFLNDYLVPSMLTDYDKWIARWTYYYRSGASNNPIRYSTQPSSSTWKPENCQMWQFSDLGDGNYYGVELKRIDMDYSYIDYGTYPGYPKSTDPDDYDVPKGTLAYGSTNNSSQVSWAQAVMLSLGYRVAVSGKFTAYMKSVVEKMQKDFGLAVNGKIDEPTLKALLIVQYGSSCKFRLYLKNYLGSETVGLGEFRCGNEYMLPKCPFSIDGLTFVGWNVKRYSDSKWLCEDGNWYKAADISGKKTLFKKGDAFNIDAGLLSEELENEKIVFYALWKAKSSTNPDCAHLNLCRKNVLDATCSAKGYTGDIVCKDCKDIVVVGENIAKLPHTYGEYVTDTTATVKAEGAMTKTCAVCGKKYTATIKKIQSFTLSQKSFVYDGKAHKPTITILNSDGKKISSKYYTVSFSTDVKSLGTHSLTVTFKDRYSGSKTLKYSIKLGKVTGLKVAKATTSSLRISWKLLPGAKYYQLWKSTDGKSWEKVKTSTKDYATATGLKTASKYYFRVIAIDPTKAFKSPASSTLVRATLTKAPSIKLSNAKTSVGVSWNKVSGAKSYAVYSKLSGSEWKKVGETSKLSFTIKNQPTGKQIYVKVYALNSYSMKSEASSSRSLVVGVSTPKVGNVKNGYITYSSGKYYMHDLSTGAKFILVNKSYTVPSSYAPGGLTSDCRAAFSKLVAAAKRDGVSIYSVSDYRPYAQQNRIYNNYVSRYGRTYADKISARPGHSEHQTGLAIDCNSLSDSFANTTAGRWLAAHCAEYGFIIRYGRDKISSTGYNFEPWHIRYIGSVKLAKKLTASGLSVEEYYGISSKY